MNWYNRTMDRDSEPYYPARFTTARMLREVRTLRRLCIGASPTNTTGNQLLRQAAHIAEKLDDVNTLVVEQPDLLVYRPAHWRCLPLRTP